MRSPGVDEPIPFVTNVRALLDSFLERRQYTLSDVQVADSGLSTAVFYTSSRNSLVLYYSVRGGEVNCLMPSLYASRSDLGKPDWKYLTRILLESGLLTKAELYARSAEPIQGWEAQLRQVVEELTTNFPLVEAGAPTS